MANVFGLFLIAGRKVDMSTTAKLESLLGRSLKYEATQSPRGLRIRIACEYESPEALEELLRKNFPAIKTVILSKKPVVTVSEGKP